MIPGWLWKLPMDLIVKVSDKYALDKNFVASIVITESSGNPLATRYESHYKWLVNPRGFAENLGISEITEETHQKTSWGLMQVMGGLARDLGYKKHIVNLCRDPEIGLDLGCKYLKQQLERYGTYEKAIAAYNAGSVRMKNGFYVNQQYVDKVFKKYREISRID